MYNITNITGLRHHKRMDQQAHNSVDNFTILNKM